jgi:crotonobetainyl-CoA:carnitine CoA-transferase CaiB-like acyl-CoA transferase
MVNILGPAILDYAINGRIQVSPGNRDPDAAPHGAFRCKGDDAWCAIAVFTDEEWRAFCRAIGDPEWTKDARFATPRSRKENEDELDKRVEEWTSIRTTGDAMQTLQKAGMPAGPCRPLLM